MGDQENLDIFLRAKNETDPAFKKADENVKGLQGSTKALTGGLKGLTAGFADINGALSVAGMVADKVRVAYDQVMTKTMEWGGVIEDNARLIGENAEQTSRLLIAGRSLGIQQETMTQALETAISRGVRPNIEGLKKMADEYVALKDPLDQSAYLMEKFGRRAGPEMAELLGQGSAGMERYMQDAERTGMVIDTKAVAAAERYQIATEKLQQRMDGVSVSMGNTLIPAASILIDTMMKTGDVVQDNNLHWLVSIPLLGQVSYAILAVANADKIAKDQKLDLIATMAREEMALNRVANAGGQHHQYASDMQPGTGRGNLYTGQVYTPPGRAAGGPMWAGVSRPVGERGIEWFTPEQNGTIGDQPAGGGGMSIGQVIFQIKSSEPQAVRREVEQVIRDLQAVGRL